MTRPSANRLIAAYLNEPVCSIRVACASPATVLPLWNSWALAAGAMATARLRAAKSGAKHGFHRFAPSTVGPTTTALLQDGTGLDIAPGRCFLIRWARNKFKRLRLQPRGAREWFARVVRGKPSLFAHWDFCMSATGHREPYEAIVSSTVLGAPGGEFPWATQYSQEAATPCVMSNRIA
jgi:hypothetical protein